MLKHLLAIALCALIGLFGAFGISKFLIAPQYTASVKMFVEMTDQSAVNIYGLNELNYVRSLVPSYIEMLQVNDFYRKLAEDANVDYTPAQLRDDIGFSIQNDTQVFKISVSTRSAADSKAIADAVAVVAPQHIDSLGTTARIKLAESAELPVSPSSPNVLMNTLVGGVLGIVLAMLVILVKEMLDTRVKGEEDLAQHYTIPLLGTIPDFTGGNKKK